MSDHLLKAQSRLDDDSRLPKYSQVMAILTRMISQLESGDPLPPERALSEHFGVSRTTVRQALRELEVEGRLQRHQGRGTFVARPKVRQQLTLTSYTEDMRQRGLVPGSKLLEVMTVQAAGDIAERLHLPPGSSLLRIRRMRLADAEPMAIETVHVDAKRFDWIPAELEADASLYELFRARGIELRGAEQAIEATVASLEEAELLDIEADQPMLQMTRVSFDQHGIPVEHVSSLYRGDRYRLITQLLPPGAAG